MKKRKEPKSLNKRLLTFMILCWLIPIMIFFAATTVSYQKGIIEKAEGLMEDELINLSSFVSIRIGDAIALCQRPSYEKTWENAWGDFKHGNSSLSEYLQEVNTNIKGKFYTDERFQLYAYYCYGFSDPQCYSSRTRASYQDYVENIQPQLEDILKTDTSYAFVRIINGRIFIIRNLYTTVGYQRYGTLVVELNQDKVFQDVPEDIRENMIVCIGDEMLDFTVEQETDERDELTQTLLEKYDETFEHQLNIAKNMYYNGYMYQENYSNYHMGIMVFAKRSEIYSSLYEIYRIVLGMLLVLIPVFIYAISFLRKQIQIPVERIIEGYQKVENGEVGSTIVGDVMPNEEFQYLRKSFDRMSLQVKLLFDDVYNEKLARKDAQIQALQAQINPHFLNNTLEMMNWQARMSQDVVVSKMIESLGTVLDYRINRANVKEIHLAEELQCTDAYFYIMSMRFGQRLQIEREIDDKLLYIMVPPLILQPIVENAIVHGIEAVKNGSIRLKVFHDEEKVYLQVINTGKQMTDKEKERIELILNGDENDIPQSTGKHTSIGIRNVNRRIKLVYGEEYGLTLEQNEAGETLSTIIIPYRE